MNCRICNIDVTELAHWRGRISNRRWCNNCPPTHAPPSNRNFEWVEPKPAAPRYKYETTKHTPLEREILKRNTAGHKQAIDLFNLLTSMPPMELSAKGKEALAQAKKFNDDWVAFSGGNRLGKRNATEALIYRRAQASLDAMRERKQAVELLNVVGSAPEMNHAVMAKAFADAMAARGKPVVLVKPSVTEAQVEAIAEATNASVVRVDDPEDIQQMIAPRVWITKAELAAMQEAGIVANVAKTNESCGITVLDRMLTQDEIRRIDAIAHPDTADEKPARHPQHPADRARPRVCAYAQDVALVSMVAEGPDGDMLTADFMVLGEQGIMVDPLKAMADIDAQAADEICERLFAKARRCLTVLPRCDYGGTVQQRAETPGFANRRSATFTLYAKCDTCGADA